MGPLGVKLKVLDIVFPRAPHNPVLAKRFGYCDSMKYGSVERFSRLHFKNKILIQKTFLKTVSIEDQLS